MNLNGTLEYALIGIALFAMILVILFLYLFTQRLKQNRFEQQIQTYIQTHMDDWYNYLIADSDTAILHELRVVSTTDKAAIDRIFTRYVKNIKNEDIRDKIAHYNQLNSRKFYLKKLQSKNWGERISILYKISDFKMFFLVPEVEKLLRRTKKLTLEEYVICLKILAIYNRNLFLAHLYKPKMHLGEFEYKKLIHELDESYFQEFKERFDQLPINLRVSFIEILGYEADSSISSITFLEGLLDHYDSEFRIRAMKALAHISAYINFERYKQFANSTIWEERLMFAKLLIHIPEDLARPYLEKLIEDEVWFVRKQAATTLSKIKNGMSSLNQIIQSSNDQYAVDAAKESLRKE